MEYRYLGPNRAQGLRHHPGRADLRVGIGPGAGLCAARPYLEAGGNYVDAADSYNKGESERIVGRWVKERGVRGRMLLGRRCSSPPALAQRRSALSRKHIHQSVEESLRRLGTDALDLYQLHCFDRMTPLDETLRALDDLVRAGKVRYVGVSNFAPSHLQKAIMLCRARGLAPVAACSSSTACWCGARSGSCCRSAWRRGSARWPGRRWPGAG